MMVYGMIGYANPLERFPHTYNGQPLTIAALAAQKNYLSVYLMGVYGDEATHAWFVREWKQSGKKLDMGKSCVRFRLAEDIPLDVLGKAIARVSVDQLMAAHERAYAKGQ